MWPKPKHCSRPWKCWPAVALATCNLQRARCCTSCRRRCLRVLPAHATARALRAVPVSLPYWQPLHAAIAAGRSVHLRYRTLHGALSDRTVYPLGLFHWGRHWTLGSWCGLRQAYRDFRLDQIEVLAEADGLALPAPVGLEAYLRHQRQAWTLHRH